MKLVITTRNEIDEMGIEALREDLGVSPGEDLIKALQEKYQELYGQVVEENLGASQHSNLTWELHYEC